MSRIHDIKAKWQALPVREQRLVLLAVGVLFFGLVYVGGVRPWLAHLDRLQNKVATLEKQLAWMKSQAPKLAQKSGRTAFRGSLTQAVTDSARRYGIVLNRVRPREPNGVQLWVEQAPAEQLLSWIQAMRNQGLVISQIQINKKKSGIVSASLTAEG